MASRGRLPERHGGAMADPGVAAALPPVLPLACTIHVWTAGNRDADALAYGQPIGRQERITDLRNHQ